MTMHRVVSEADWLEARRAHLAKEKEFTNCATSSRASAASCRG